MKVHSLNGLQNKFEIEPGLLRVGLKLIFACSVWLFSPVVMSNPEPTEHQLEQGKEAVATAGEETEETSRKSLLDRHKDYVDTQVQRASMWADGFFVDPNYEAEQANSQFRLRPEIYYSKEDDFKFRARFRARINLPNMGRRVSLVVGADEESGFDDSVDDSPDDGVIGLQFFMKESSRWNTSLSVGVKFNDFAGFIGPRARYTGVLGEKGSYRFTQTIRWQTNQYWQINTRLDLNRVISDSLFFRQTFDGRWRGERSDKEGYRTQISSFLTQRVGPVSGLQYEFSTVFHTEPDTHVDEYVLAVRYRKRTKRDWLYYEIIPQVSFEDEFDYAFNPGIRLRLEFFYGGEKTKEFWRRELEDSEDFRW